jgi:hypothetical protein
MSNGYVIYEGPSAIDGAPIVVIATGFDAKTRNAKTGDMIQTWIIRADVSPVEAIRQKLDSSVCGDCLHRSNPETGKRTCYVKVWQAPRSIYEAYKRGIYPRISIAELAHKCAQRMIRFGSYGDPYAAPFWLWEAMASAAKGWTGYTHQWRKLGKDWQRLLMASADSLADMESAHSAGWRTFRVSAKAGEAIKGREVTCPASKEMGARTDCASCRACMGLASKARVSIQIAKH